MSVYEDLIAEVDDELEKRIMDILLQAYPETSAGIERRDLVGTLFGYWPDNLASNKHDRIIRKAIEHLREQFPIISSSGGRGYRLSEDLDEINAFAAEQASRAAKETEKARQAHAWPAKIRSIQEARKSGEKWTQEPIL